MSIKRTPRGDGEATARSPRGRASFNLIDEPWIPVLWRDGKPERVGIRKALTEAGKIRQIAASNPLDNVALLRFLLAVLQWCKPELSGDDRATRNDADGIPTDWLKSNLGEEGAANPTFNLLGGSRRFMQAPKDTDNRRPVADLFHELPGGTNVVHLRHIADNREGVCPACISIGLARLPIAMTGKGSAKDAITGKRAGKHPGINGDPPFYFVPVGNTLLETLTLNWPLANIRGDRPCWLASARSANAPVGVMEGFTWTSRQFRIADDGLRSGSCMVCGADTESLVTCLHELNRPNGRDGLSRCRYERWRDPHVAYDGDTKKAWRAEDAENAEKNLPGSSGQWREWLGAAIGSHERIEPPAGVVSATRALKPGAGLRVQIVGFPTRTDKSVECWQQEVEIPAKEEAADCATRDRTKMLADLDKLVARILDPHVDLKGKRLHGFKDRHPLMEVRSPDRPLPNAVRSALAERLPALECAMFDVVRFADPVATGNVPAVSPSTTAGAANWKSLVAEVADATTPGSPLRRREARLRALKALEVALTAKPGAQEAGAARANRAGPATVDSGKSRRSRGQGKRKDPAR
jgi:CRISPR type I-E-associated protein CasA/Cse1